MSVVPTYAPGRPREHLGGADPIAGVFRIDLTPRQADAFERNNGDPCALTVYTTEADRHFVQMLAAGDPTLEKIEPPSTYNLMTDLLAIGRCALVQVAHTLGEARSTNSFRYTLVTPQDLGSQVLSVVDATLVRPGDRHPGNLLDRVKSWFEGWGGTNYLFLRVRDTDQDNTDAVKPRKVFAQTSQRTTSAAVVLT